MELARDGRRSFDLGREMRGGCPAVPCARSRHVAFSARDQRSAFELSASRARRVD